MRVPEIAFEGGEPPKGKKKKRRSSSEENLILDERTEGVQKSAISRREAGKSFRGFVSKKSGLSRSRETNEETHSRQRKKRHQNFQTRHHPLSQQKRKGKEARRGPFEERTGKEEGETPENDSAAIGRPQKP